MIKHSLSVFYEKCVIMKNYLKLQNHKFYFYISSSNIHVKKKKNKMQKIRYQESFS